MKRDMDLIRLILLEREGNEDAAAKMKEYSEQEVVYNAALLVKAGLIEGEVREGPDGSLEGGGVAMWDLTWAGHDFLDAARDDTIWKKARQKILTPGASFTFDLLKEWLKAEVRAKLGGFG